MGASNNANEAIRLYNRIARLAARSVGAPIAIVNVRQGRQLAILGTYGLYVDVTEDAWPLGTKLEHKRTMTYVEDIRRELALKDHPLLKYAPFARSLVHIPARGYHADTEASITIINPRAKWPFTALVSETLTELSMLVGDTLKREGAKSSAGRTAMEALMPGLAEAGESLAARTGSNRIVENFLFSTLKKRVSIRNRNDAAYVTARTWAKPIRQYQIDALHTIKAAPNDEFAGLIAAELAEHVKKLFGVGAINCVVPVPCGSSGLENGLSFKIAKNLALQLGIEFVDAFKSFQTSGKSHPRKNTRLGPPELKIKKQLGSVLLVDDVATSGRHIELTTQALRGMTDHISTIVWIGSD